MAEIYQKIQAKKQELLPLYNRMNSDLDLYNLKAYKLLDYDGSELKRVDSVTLNDARTYADRFISIATSSEMVVDLKGDLDDDAVSAIKREFHTALYEADRALKAKRLGKVKRNLVKIAAIRGIMGVRVLFWEEEGKLVYNILPLDTRNCAWEYGLRNILWCSYEQNVPRAAIEAEWGKDIGKKLGLVTEYWDKDAHIIYAGTEKVLEEENTLGYPPVFIENVGSGIVLSMPMITDLVKYTGESIYTSNRETYESMNKLASFWMTTAGASFRPDLQERTPPGIEPSEMSEEAKHPYGGRGRVFQMGASWFEAMPYRDIAASLPAMFGVFGTREQKGAFPDVEWGEILQRLSAIALAKLTAGRRMILEPVIESLSSAYEFILDELRKQAGILGLPLNKALQKEFHPEINFYQVSPEENIANYSVAAAARGFLDSDSIRTTILKLKDEGEVQRKMDIEVAEMMVPELKLYRVAEQLKSEGRTGEAALIYRKLGMALQPEAQKAVPPAKPTAEMPQLGVEMPPVGEEEIMRGEGQRESREMGIEMGREGELPPGER